MKWLRTETPKDSLTRLGRLITAECPVCGLETSSDSGLCAACCEHLPWISVSCPICGEPLTQDVRAGQRCGRCLRAPPAFDSTQALFHYAKPVRQLISLFKFHGRLEIGASFAYLLALRFQHTVRRLPTSARPQLLLPVPLHPRRMNMRGFNQSEELVRGLSSLAGIPSCRSLVRRVRHTPSQTEMTDAASRRRNLRSAFTVQACAKLGTIRRVAVVDDVMTTGATVDALAQSLKAHGVAQVDVWCLARAGL